MMKTLSKDKTYAAGRCPLKKQCLWHTMKHTEASCIDVSRFDGDNEFFKGDALKGWMPLPEVQEREELSRFKRGSQQ